MDLNQSIDKFFWSNIIGDRVDPGMFSFDVALGYIKDCVKNKESLGVEKFINYLKNKERDKIEYFSKIIITESNCDRKEFDQALFNRMYQVFYGLQGEAILENMYNLSSQFTVLPVSKEEDYLKKIDLKILENSSRKIMNIQVKSSSYFYSPTKYQMSQLNRERAVHEKNMTKVLYAFYHSNFEDRHYVIENERIPIYGYGYGSVDYLEKITKKLFNSIEDFEKEKVTLETIIF